MSIVARSNETFIECCWGRSRVRLALPTLGQPGADEPWVATGPPRSSRGRCRGEPPRTPRRHLLRPPPLRRRALHHRARRRRVTASNQTLRQVVHTSIGGDRVRVVLSNAFGTTPLEVAAAAIGPRAQNPSVRATTVHPLTFGGQKSAAILAGAMLVSDPVDMAVAPLTDVVVDLYLPGDLGIGPSPVTTHNGASQTNYLSVSGNHVGALNLPLDKEAGAWFLLARVEVAAPIETRAVVTFGDSITDGARSTPNANARWPDFLARRLNAQRRGPRVAVLNAGISGNRVLGDGAGLSALARFDKDVLMQTGVTHVVVMEGINDIGVARANPSPSADDLIAAHRQLIARAHARGLTIYGATLTPFEGAGYYTPEGEAKRQALNTGSAPAASTTA